MNGLYLFFLMLLAGKQLYRNGNVTGEGEKEEEVKKALPILPLQPRHENKSCSACPEDQPKHLTYDM